MDEVSTQPLTPQGAALYIHWPFCKKKCPYCDFNSHVRDGIDHSAWRAALLREMAYWHAQAGDTKITSIFFGGGTPSLMEPATVGALIAQADTLWGLDANCEITLEANPTSVEAAKFSALRAAGVNRVSLGVQSLREDSLTFLGREHSAKEALEAVALAATLFDRYSFDLIYALPNQTLDAWAKELKEALGFARGHLSLYQLTIEENTAFHHAYHVGKSFQLPVDSLAADMYQLTQTIMEDAGMPAYEISNHAAPGQESRHNLSYWKSECYFGIGPGAHGRVDHKDHPEGHPGQFKFKLSWEETPMQDSLNSNCPERARVATRTLKSPERWLDAVVHYGHGIEEELPLTLVEHAEEAVLMGLRLREGFDMARLPTPSAAYLQQRWADGRIDRLVGQGMLEASPLHLRATTRGRLVLNRVIEELLA
jgi:putative oxygen-independent coproporphyrinogen III oxidase